MFVRKISSSVKDSDAMKWKQRNCLNLNMNEIMNMRLFIISCNTSINMKMVVDQNCIVFETMHAFLCSR